MSRLATIALVLAAAIGSAAAAAANDERALSAPRAAPTRLFEGRDAGPNELHRICVVDAGGGRVRPCTFRY